MSPAAQALRPFVARQWRALAGAGASDRGADRGRPREAVAAGAGRRPAARRTDRAVRARARGCPAARRGGGARARDRPGRIRGPVLRRPAPAGRGRAHRPRAAHRRLRPAPASLARLPPAPPEGRPADPRDQRRQRDGRPVRAVARPDHPGGAAVGRDDRRAAVAGSGARAGGRGDLAAAGGGEPRLPAPHALAGARAAHPGRPDRLDRGRGAVGDGDRQGVRLGDARVRPRAPRQRGPHGGGRRGGAAAGSLRRARRRRSRSRYRARARGGRAPRRARCALPRRADRLRLLHAQGAQPAPADGARDDQGRGGDGANGAARGDPRRRRGAGGAPRRVPRGPCDRRARARTRVVRLCRRTARVARPHAAGAGRRIASRSWARRAQASRRSAP